MNTVSRQDYHRAAELGRQAARCPQSTPDRNPWANAHTEAGRILRDAWADAYYQTKGAA